eukprot:GHVT01034586.1.p1 GENE.GHVT01034586.1~~GHVT01034586.1.p1  ORF type:complete len:117 (-),score=26.73 GHVT01034586.1:303-653(-)
MSGRSYSCGSAALRGMAAPWRSFDFEVFGVVQGVFFRKHTQAAAVRLGLVGYCCNSSHGTVQGVVQGKERDALAEMKRWLRTTGSPKSKITRCCVHNERDLQTPQFAAFEIRRNPD